MNPYYGKGFVFHGSFTSLILARRREKSIPGAFIQEKNGRYYVLQPKKIRNSLGPRHKKHPYIVGRLKTIMDSGTKWGSTAQILLSRGSWTDAELAEARRIITEYERYRKDNPGKPRVQIYGRVLRIEAQKTGKHRCDAECRKCGHRYFHDFKGQPKMIGLSPGDVVRVPAGVYPILLMPRQ